MDQLLAVPAGDKARKGSIRELFDNVLTSASSSTSLAQFSLDEVVKSGRLEDLKRAIHHHSFLDPRSWQEPGTHRSLLHLAAMSNQAEIIEYLLGECKVDMNVQDRDGNTALHLAVVAGHLEATAAVLSYKPNCSLCNKDHDPPLHIAIKQGAQGVSIVSEFVKHPTINLFVKGYHDYTSLHVIARGNNLKALELIHSATSESAGIAGYMFLKNKRGSCAFHLASSYGSNDVLSSLLSIFSASTQPMDALLTAVSDDSRMPLHYAVERGHVECAKVLLEYGADPTVVSGSHPPPIHLACTHGMVDIVKLMVDKHGASVLQSRDRDGGTTLHSSTVSINSKDLVSFLVHNGVNPNDVDYKGYSPLSNAIQLGSVDAVEELLNQGANPLIKDGSGYTPLHRAVLSERIEIFKKVASSNVVTIMAKTADSQGYYPIHYALKLGLYDMVVALLELTSEVFVDPDGNNYLHLAAFSGNEHSFSHISGVRSFQYMINEANYSGRTPLHSAATSCNVNIVKKLLDQGAVIHKDSDGRTPFMLACSAGNLATVKLLYSRNSFQRDWVDNANSTALHLAVDSRNPAVISFCLDTGMAITLNDDLFSFFDIILNSNNRTLTKAVVIHKRWEECVDIHSPDRPHPILRILDQMPDVYQLILDNCYMKCRDLDPTHPDYWEEFNFKCLHLQQEDDQQAEIKKTTEVELEMSPIDEKGSQLHTDSTVAVEDHHVAAQRFRRRASNRRRIIMHRLGGPDVDSLTVVRKLIKSRLETYLLHPVIEHYIKMKWNGCGLYLQLAAMVSLFFFALFFSAFLAVIPLPEQDLNSTQAPFNAEMDSLNSGQIALLSISLILAVHNFVQFLFDAYVQRLRLILDFLEEFQVWSNFIASTTTFIYLVSVLVNGVEQSLWNAAALGVFFAWFSFGFSLQFVNILNIGIYITMLMSSTKLIFKVLIILLVFLLAISFSLYILVGTVDRLQYTTVLLSLFNNLHTLVGVTDYLGFVSIEQSDEESFRFSALIFLFLVVQIVILPIVIINLLIGLAVGDIAKIQKEAIITRQAVEVRALSSLDRRLLKCCLNKQLLKHYHKHYPNRRSLGRLIKRFFHKTFDSKNIFREDVSKRNLEDIVKKDLLEEKEKHEKQLCKIQETLEVINADRLELLDEMSRLRTMVMKLIKAQKNS